MKINKGMLWCGLVWFGIGIVDTIAFEFLIAKILGMVLLTAGAFLITKSIEGDEE